MRVLAIVLVIGITAALVLGFYALMWLLWCWVLPQVFPAAPQGLIAPSYWLFVGCGLLLAWAGQLVFGRRAKS